MGSRPAADDKPREPVIGPGQSERANIMRQVVLALVLFYAGVLGGSITLGQTAISAAGAPEQVMTNEDLIILVKAGLSDAAILAAIGKSKTQFDTSPSGLVKLKEGGVSNAIIEAILGGGQPTAPASSAPGPEPRPTDATTEPALPSSYGYYILDAGKLREVEASPVTTIVGLRPVASPAQEGFAVDGLGDQPSATVAEGFPIFYVYQQNVDITDVHISELAYAPSMKAYEFNMIGTDANFFAGIYGRGYNDVIPIGLWRAKGDVQVRVQPVEGKAGMFRLTPVSALLPGRYALYHDKSLHLSSMIFATAAGRRASALYFSVRASEGALAAVCNDYAACIQSALSDYRTRNFEGALAKYEKASRMESQKPDAWGGLGAIKFQMGRPQEAAPMWDKFLALGGTYELHACRERSMWCDMGTVVLTTEKIRFLDRKGNADLDSQISDIEEVKGGMSALQPRFFWLQMEVGGKKYKFDPIPEGVPGCATENWYFYCPEPGASRQKQLVEYLVAAIEKTRKGELRGVEAAKSQ